MQDRLQRFHMNVNQEIGLRQLAIVLEIAISPSSAIGQAPNQKSPKSSKQ